MTAQRLRALGTIKGVAEAGDEFDPVDNGLVERDVAELLACGAAELLACAASAVLPDDLTLPLIDQAGLPAELAEPAKPAKPAKAGTQAKAER